MRTKQTIAMSTRFTNQAVQPISQPVWRTSETEPGAARATLRKRSHAPWQWLSGIVLSLIGLLVQQPLLAQTYCAPDATAYYTFEQTRNDRSSYDDAFNGGEGPQNSTSTNYPTFSTTAKVGNYSASFDGSQYIRYDNAFGYMQNGGNSISIMFWFKANAPGTGAQVMFEQGDATNGIGIRLDNTTGQLQARIRVGAISLDLTGPNITDNNWHHVALTYALGAVTPNSKLYLDGTLRSSGTAGSIGNSTNPGGIGASLNLSVWNGGPAANSMYFNGFIDDFVYSIGQDVNAVGVGPSVFQQTVIDNYLACVNGFATNKFTCNGDVYNVIYPPTQVGIRGSDLIKFNYATNSFSTVDGTGSLGYNALGYNQIDNYLYGIRYGAATEEDYTSRNNTLLRVGADGTIEDLGFISGLPATATAFYNSADISPAGIMYITNSNLGKYYTINLNVKPYAATEITMPVLYVGDWAYNPNDGFLYGVSLIGTVIKINATTGARVIVNPTNGSLPDDNYASVWFDQFNNLYAMGNRMVRYSITTNSWSTVLRSSEVPDSGGTDGAACPVTSADPQITKAIQSQSGNTVTFDITLRNNGPSPVADLNVRDALPAGLVFQSAQLLDASNTALPTTDYTITTPAVGANGTILLKLNNLSVSTTNQVVLRLTVKAASGICNQTITNCAEIISAFGQTASNGTLGNTGDNTTTIPGDVAANNESCAPVSFSLSAAAPTATASATATCSGDLFTINYTNIATGGTLVWNRMPGNVSGAGNVSEALSNTTTAPISYTYTASVQNLTGCPSLPVVTVVTVNPRPTVVPSVCSLTICSGQTGNITFTPSIPGSTIHWTRTPTTPAPSSGTGDISQVLTNTGPTSVTYTYYIWAESPAPASCPSSTTITCEIVVTPGLTVLASANSTSVCVGSPLSLSAGVSQTGTYTYSWVGPNGYVASGVNPQVSATAALTQSGSYTVTVTDASGCSGTAVATVTVGNCCDLSATATPTSVTSCLTPNSGSIAITYTGSQSYQYTLNGGSATALTGSPATISGLAAGSYTIVVQAVGTPTCSQTLVTQVIGYNLGVALGSNSPLCTGNALDLVATPGGGTAPYSFTYTGPAGVIQSATTQTTISIPATTSANAGVYAVRVSDAIGCTALNSTTVTITNAPALTLTAGSGLTICSGESTTLNVGGSNGAPVSWTNTLGQTGTGTTINTGSLTNIGTLPMQIVYNVAAAAGLCSSVTSATLTVNPEPRLQVVPSAAVYCNIEQVNVQANVFPNTSTINWIRTPATPNPPVATGTGIGMVTIQQTLPAANYTYSFTATGTNGCTSQSVNVPVTVQQ